MKLPNWVLTITDNISHKFRGEIRMKIINGGITDFIQIESKKPPKGKSFDIPLDTRKEINLS